MAQLPEVSPVVTYRIDVEQDDTPVRGNAMASGDDAADTACEDEILARLERGDVWAWAGVTVVAECEDFEGFARLGCCSYKNEVDFRADAQFEDLKSEALSYLKQNLDCAIERGADAVKLKRALGD